LFACYSSAITDTLFSCQIKLHGKEEENVTTVELDKKEGVEKSEY
jgi:hypothetical protein